MKLIRFASPDVGSDAQPAAAREAAIEVILANFIEMTLPACRRVCNGDNSHLAHGLEHSAILYYIGNTHAGDMR